MRARVLLFALALASLVSACKQDSGDYCQVDDDCQLPLRCNAGTNTCQRGSGGVVDAGAPADARLPPDAAPAPVPDAATEKVDAAVVIDAAPAPDAAL
ncbi:MAG TPA: hypothetical protein VK698_22095 [Kofleriaceae bacterium]|nr:hypothetical protein [Kofleriaceae bacterium]